MVDEQELVEFHKVECDNCEMIEGFLERVVPEEDVKVLHYEV